MVHVSSRNVFDDTDYKRQQSFPQSSICFYKAPTYPSAQQILAGEENAIFKSNHINFFLNHRKQKDIIMTDNLAPSLPRELQAILCTQKNLHEK